MSEHSVRDGNRFDVEVEIVDFDPETGRGRVPYHIHPDPGRYEWRDEPAGRFLYDRFDGFRFSHAFVIDMLKRALQMEQAAPLAVITDVAAYVASRRPVIAAALRGEQKPRELVDLSEAQLRAFDKDELAFVILSVNIKGSTKLQTTSDRKTFARTINVLLTDMGELVVRFHGHILKHTGDGLIAYFAEPTFIIKNDAAVDCAYCIRRLIYEAVNRSSSGRGCRRSTCGSASTAARRRSRSSAPKRRSGTPDLIGEVVSLACKIESRGNRRDLPRETVERNLQFRWRELCERVELPPDWTYLVRKGEPYALFRLDWSGTRPVE